MSPTLRIGRVFGFQVDVGPSWIATYALASLSLVAICERVFPDAPVAVAPLLGIAAATIGALALAVHELAHGLVLRTIGVPVRRIFVFLVGSVTDVERAPSPKTEVLVAMLALLINAVAALAFHALVVLGYGHFPHAFDDLPRLGYGGALLAWAAVVNAAIVLFELVPAYPLDGGRLLRALARRLTGSFDRATRCAALASQVVGWSLVGAGVALSLIASLAALWLALVGWFLATSSSYAYGLSARKADQHGSALHAAASR